MEEVFLNWFEEKVYDIEKQFLKHKHCTTVFVYEMDLNKKENPSRQSLKSQLLLVGLEQFFCIHKPRARFRWLLSIKYFPLNYSLMDECNATWPIESPIPATLPITQMKMISNHIVGKHWCYLELVYRIWGKSLWAHPYFPWKLEHYVEEIYDHILVQLHGACKTCFLKW